MSIWHNAMAVENILSNEAADFQKHNDVICHRLENCLKKETLIITDDTLTWRKWKWVDLQKRIRHRFGKAV
jgi:hypothetical protein